MNKLLILAKHIISPLQKLVAKKHYIEFITAVLSIPVLITVIILNISTLKSSAKEKVQPTPTPIPVKEKIYTPLPVRNSQPRNESLPTPIPSIGNQTNISCTPELGQISITSPGENEIVKDNPVSIIVNYKADNNCAAVWSYRINNGKWSDYDDKSIALYNLTNGQIKLELKAKSIVSGQEQTITRTFINEGNTTDPTPSPQLQEPQTASPTANQ